MKCLVIFVYIRQTLSVTDVKLI